MCTCGGARRRNLFQVTEGGVTRRVARAMEVLQASGPGARMRVMRAAYHSTSGPGIPASSYMLHSSRRVISSGFNILESPTYPTQPLEISSTPLESSPESNHETENYKVTEPDDMDISEPSKWRGTTGGSSIRMPSEESSSTDNASIIDLDSRFSRKGLHRKYSYDSENSDVHSLKRESARTSPLLDAPVTLSTLKYKSLLNSSNEWNNRRKSYSFEDTSPLNEIILHSNDTLAMESSTDSGICKSSEIVNDNIEDAPNKDFVNRERKYIHDSIDNWHHKNLLHPSYRRSKIKTHKEHDVVIEDPHESNIALQSTGKLTITVPITIESEDIDDYKKSNDDGDRKVKKVEFCKTELHFAAESGRVNIIATDEKPPPTNDFRKRRSAFVPIKEKFEKPITLFGDKGDFIETRKIDECQVRDFSETAEFDENTAATKSILKNKIPKPKPYLLGENMAFGNIGGSIQTPDSPVSIGVSLINKELQTNRTSSNNQTLYNSLNETRTVKSFTNSLRTSNKGPSKVSGSENPNIINERYSSQTDHKLNSEGIKGKLHVLQMSPVPKPKTRQLRESDLTYFGIAQHHVDKIDHKIDHTASKTALPWTDSSQNTFESVRLVKKYSSSAQNSDTESIESPDYQNLPLKTNFAPVPIPRSRVKYAIQDEEQRVTLNPISEQVYTSNKVTHDSRRSRSRKQDDLMTFTSRSLSAPAKNMRHDGIDKIHQYDETRIKNFKNTKDNRKASGIKVHNNKGEDAPLYANLDGRKSDFQGISERPRINEIETINKTNVNEKKKTTIKPVKTEVASESNKTEVPSKEYHRVRRTEKLSTPEKSNNSYNKDTLKSKKKNDSDISNVSSLRDKDIKSRQKLNKDADIKENHQVKQIKIPDPLQKDKGVKNYNSHTKESNKKDIDTPHSNKRILSNSLEHRIHSKPSNIEKDGSEKVGVGMDGRRSSRRSEYVIKYDDKNGTVSSICKVRSGHSTPRKKHASKDRNKEYVKNSKPKYTEKSSLRNAAPCPSDSKRKK